MLSCTLPAFATGSGSVTLPRTGQESCYDEAGVLIACAGTGQDGNVRAGAAWPIPRFLDNGNGTVTDSLTGLIWLRDANCAGIPVYWNDALTFAGALADGQCGLTDGSIAGAWRLPNRKELLTLLDRGQGIPATALGAFFINVQASDYWTSTTVAASPAAAWAIGMNFSNMATHGKETTGCLIWPVRAGQ